MLSPTLPSHRQIVAKQLGNKRRERPLPSYWPGTYVPNLSDWQEGDLVLVEGRGLTGALIQAAQSITTHSGMLQGAQWSHVAVYVGDGKVVDDGFPHGVTERSLWEYCERRCITVRRLGDPGLSTAAKRGISVAARSHVGESYSVLQAVLAKLGLPSAQTPNPSALFCSTFAGLVVAEATGIRLWSDPAHQPLLPAVLALHPDLDPVPLEWRNI